MLTITHAEASSLILAAVDAAPSPSARLQLAELQADVALMALRAGDTAACQAFLEDALLHLRAARGGE